MCDPILFGTAAASATGTTAATAATAGLFGTGGSFALGQTLSTVGTLFGAASAYQQGQAQEASAKQQAMTAQMQAEDAIERGRIAEAEKRRQIARVRGAQRAALGASGVELDSGSASDLQADTAMLGELDALTIRNNAQREAYGYRSTAAAKMSEAKQYGKKKFFDAGGTLMGGFGGTLVNNKWYDKKSALQPGANMSTDYGSQFI